MIILMSQEEFIIEFSGGLKKLYNETIASVNGSFLNAAKNKKEWERLTFIGHSSDKSNSFGDNGGWYTPRKFAEMLDDQLKQKGVTHPVTIDLIGCETGFVRNDTSFSQEVLKELNLLNRKNVTVKSFFFAEDKDYGGSRIILKPDGECKITIYDKISIQTVKDLEQKKEQAKQMRTKWDQLYEKKKRKRNEIINKIKILREQLKSISLHSNQTTQQSINELASVHSIATATVTTQPNVSSVHSEHKDTSSREIKKSLEPLDKKKLEGDLENQETELAATTKEYEAARKGFLASMETLLQYDTAIVAYKTVLFTTKNPRQHLDEHSECQLSNSSTQTWLAQAIASRENKKPTDENLDTPLLSQSSQKNEEKGKNNKRDCSLFSCVKGGNGDN